MLVGGVTFFPHQISPHVGDQPDHCRGASGAPGENASEEAQCSQRQHQRPLRQDSEELQIPLKLSDHCLAVGRPAQASNG